MMPVPAARSPVPCAVVTGALGSGKTTLIRALMKRPDMQGTALIINEYGEIGIDHLMVSSAVETTLLMENGCLCCSLRGDLVDTILNLFGAVDRGEVPPFERIVIETTGLADPVPIVRDLATAPALEGMVRLASVCTTVDGVLGRAGIRDDPVALDQVAQADICLVTKTDLTDDLALDQLKEMLRSINPIMTLQEVRNGEIPRDNPLFSTVRPTGHAPPDDELQPASHAHSPHNLHGGIESWSTTIDHPLPWTRFRDWFDLVYSLNASRMLRMKGFLWLEERHGPLLVQAVGPVVTSPQLLETWPDGKPMTRLVLIAKGLTSKAIGDSFAAHVINQVATREGRANLASEN